MRVFGHLDLNPTRLAVLQRCGRVAEANSLAGQFQACVARMTAADNRFEESAAPMFRDADGTITLSAELAQTPHFGAFPPDHEDFRHCLLAAKAAVPLYVAH